MACGSLWLIELTFLSEYWYFIKNIPIKLSERALRDVKNWKCQASLLQLEQQKIMQQSELI